MKVEHSVVVNVPAERAFRAFTEEIAAWWPVDSHSYAEERHQDLVLERRVGGRLFELAVDGVVYEIGHVTTYDPPTALAFTWRNAAGTWEGETMVDVRFTEVDGATRVDLEHRGWDGVSPRRDEIFGSYRRGWPEVLGHYERHVGAAE